MHTFRLLPLLALSVLILSGCSLFPSATPVPSPSPTPDATQKSDQPTPAGTELLKNSSMQVPDTEATVSWSGESATATFENPPMRGTVTQLPQFTQKLADGTYVTYVAINNGGSGELFYLATFVPGENMFEGKDLAFLGDRIQPTSLTVNGSTVSADFLDHTPDQAMVEAPTVAVVKTFAVDAKGMLSEVESAGELSALPASTKIANPASKNCVAQGGDLVIQKSSDGSEYGVCVFEDNRQCEEWALLRGQCPVGGVKITGYEPNSEEYMCAIKGGTTKTGTAGKMTCVLPKEN